MKVPFFRFQPAGDELKNIQEVIDSGWLTTGKWAHELEARFAEYTGARHAVSVNSCTAALHLAVEALGIKEGDKVVVPSLTFTASAEVIRYVGADPVFVDVDPHTLSLNPEGLRDTLQKHSDVAAVIAVHFTGHPLDVSKPGGLKDVCREFGIKLIHDAAHAFPAYENGSPVGAAGDVTCFSFYANKTMTSGEGGMLVTDDEAVAQRAKNMRLHGIDRDVWDRFTGSKADAWVYDVKAPGFKYNMPDLNAAVAVAQFDQAWFFRDLRQKIAQSYQHQLSDLPGILLPSWQCAPEDHAHHLYPIVLEGGAKLTRGDFIHAMSDAGIGTSVHYRPLHRMSYYRDKYDLDPADYPNTEAYWSGCVSLPVFPGMKDDELDYVITTCRKLLR